MVVEVQHLHVSYLLIFFLLSFTYHACGLISVIFVLLYFLLY